MMTTETQPLSPELLTSAARLLARAFHDNPAHTHICPNEEKRSRQLTWLLGANLKMQLEQGAKSFCINQNGKVQAMGYWTNPNRKIGLVKKIEAGLLKAPLKLGISGFRRMMSASNHIDDCIANLNLSCDHFYLNNMVVHENLRGQGIGSDLLNQEIRKIKENHPRAIFSLTTQKRENVRFYQKHGFEVVREELQSDPYVRFQNWVMVKP